MLSSIQFGGGRVGGLEGRGVLDVINDGWNVICYDLVLISHTGFYDKKYITIQSPYDWQVAKQKYQQKLLK